MPVYKLGRLGDRFVVTWTDPDTGRRHRHRLAATTAKEAEAAARDLIRRLSPQRGAETVAAIWQGYTADMGERPQAGKLRAVGRIVLPVFGHLRPDQVTPPDVRGYAAARAAKGIKPGTIRTELGCLATALKWAVKAGLLDRAPVIPLPAAP